MRRYHFLSLSLALLVVSFTADCQEKHDHGASTAAAPPVTAPSQHKGQTISYNTSLGKASGYLAVPSTKGKHSAIVVIQEWWGVNDWIKDQADRFASQGYVALAPDLYHGQVATDPDHAHELMRGMPNDRAMADLKGAFNELATRRDVDPTKVGIIGWCFGGGWALQLAIKEPRAAGTVINYGSLVTDPATVANIHSPILGNFGAEDRGIPPADVKAFEQILKQTGHDVDIKIYEGAGHAFENPNNTQGYVPAAAADAQSRTDAFLAKHLGR